MASGSKGRHHRLIRSSDWRERHQDSVLNHGRLSDCVARTGGMGNIEGSDCALDDRRDYGPFTYAESIRDLCTRYYLGPVRAGSVGGVDVSGRVSYSVAGIAPAQSRNRRQEWHSGFVTGFSEPENPALWHAFRRAVCARLEGS